MNAANSPRAWNPGRYVLYYVVVVVFTHQLVFGIGHKLFKLVMCYPDGSIAMGVLASRMPFGITTEFFISTLYCVVLDP